MRMRTMISLALAVLLILAGGVLFVCTMATLHWDFTRLSTKEYETNTHVIRDDFHSIAVNTDTADVVFALSEDGSCRVICYEETNASHAVTVKNSTLTIELVEEKTVSDHIQNMGINFGSPQITVYLPQADYVSLAICADTGDIYLPEEFQFESVDISLSTGDVVWSASVSGMLKIKTSTGRIRVENANVDELDLTVSTGDVQLENIRCNTLRTTGSTGDIDLNNVIAAETVSITRTTGDICFESVDGADLFVETDTGDVTGTLLTGKNFLTHTSTGKVEVPESVTGGRCEIITSTGDIKLTIQ